MALIGDRPPACINMYQQSWLLQNITVDMNTERRANDQQSGYNHRCCILYSTEKRKYLVSNMVTIRLQGIQCRHRSLPPSESYIYYTSLHLYVPADTWVVLHSRWFCGHGGLQLWSQRRMDLKMASVTSPLLPTNPSQSPSLTYLHSSQQKMG